MRMCPLKYQKTGVGVSCLMFATLRVDMLLVAMIIRTRDPIG